MKSDRSLQGIEKKWLIPILLLILLSGTVAVLGFWEYRKVYREYIVEAGSPFSASDFLKNENDRGYFTLNSEMVEKSVPGRYELKLKTGGFVHKCTLVITDTIPPEGEAKVVSLEINQCCEAEEFVENISDATEVHVAYVEEPDFGKGGKQEVKILLTDAGGNKTEIESELLISQVKKEVYVEAGSRVPKLQDFVIEGEKAEFKTKMEDIDYNKTADRIVILQVDGLTYQSQMHIVDTIPPRVEMQDISGYTLFPRQPEDFVVSIDDVTNVEIAYMKEPDVTFVGEQEVKIRFVDEGENEVIETALLTLQEDTEAPVIMGAADMSVIVGNTVSYKRNVEVTDNCPEGCVLTVDSSAVNLNKEGTYPVIYTAEDYAGNTDSVTVNLVVRPRVYDANEVNAMADAVLAEILRDGMSPMEKVQAIYNYVTKHISYISDSEKGNPIRGAYEGLNDRKGDCYVYATTSKVLLTRAGIENMDIAKIPAKTLHYWNLVNLGDGWYHFDTTPRKDHPTIFMWTDEQLLAYSAQHSNSHNYDHSQYPVVN